MNKNAKVPSLKEKVETIVTNSTSMDRTQAKAVASKQDIVWLENQVKTYELSEYNTKQLLAKAAPLFKIDNQGRFVAPSFFTTVINWKLILDILLELLYKYIQATKTDKMLWDSHKK
jgi:hypothetical protein